MRCVLHIGTEKTGTTLLQQWFDDNRPMLKAQGIHFSDKLGLPTNRKFTAFMQDFRLDDWTMNKGIRSAEEGKHRET